MTEHFSAQGTSANHLIDWNTDKDVASDSSSDDFPLSITTPISSNTKGKGKLDIMPTPVSRKRSRTVVSEGMLSSDNLYAVLMFSR